MREREGSANIREDPSLAIHWGIAIFCYSIVIGLCIWTYWKLLQIKAKRVTLQMLGTPHEGFVWGTLIFLSLLVPVIRNGANASIPCAFVVVWVQFGSSTLATLYINRTLEFTAKSAKIILARHSLEEITTRNTSPQYKRKIRFAKFATRTFTPSNLRKILFGIFVMLFLTIFADPDNFALLLLGKEPADCIDKSRLFVMTIFLTWTITYTSVAKFIQVHDPYHIIYKFMVLDAVLIFLGLLALFVLKRLPTYHMAIAIWECSAFFLLVGWYLELYLPLRLTRKKMVEAAKGSEGTHHNQYLSPGSDEVKSISDGHCLLNTLANPKLLDLFQQHVIKEWAPENLDFIKQSVIFRLVTMRSIKSCLKAKESKSSQCLNKALKSAMNSACRIYSHFIHPDAPKLVNLPGYIRRNIKSAFQAEEFKKYLRSFTKTSSCQSSVRAVKRDGKSISFTATSHPSDSEKEINSKTRPETSRRRMDVIRGPSDTKLFNCKKSGVQSRDFCTAIAELACEGSDIQVDSYLSLTETPANKDSKKKPSGSYRKHTLRRLVEVMNIFEPARKDIFYLMECDSHRRFRNREDIRKIMDEMVNPAAMQC